MDTKKLDKKIEKQKAKLESLKERKQEILREEEEIAQAPIKEEKKKKKGKKQDKNTTTEEKIQNVVHSYIRKAPLFFSERKSLKEFLAPDFVDPNNYSYLKITDAGQDVYVRTFYPDTLPNNAVFADTFSELYNFQPVTTNVMIEPISPERASKAVDRRVVDLDTERSMAYDSGDTNLLRRKTRALANVQGWAEDIESGGNRLNDVTMFFQLYAKSKRELDALSADFRAKAMGKGFTMVSCCSVEPEAYRSGFPLNRIFKSKLGMISTMTAKTHQLDMMGLSASLFNHTKSSFYHKNGVFLGRDLSTHLPVTLDLYDRSLDAHNVIVAGATGTGKSAMIKMYLSRAADFGLKYCSIDSEPRGRRGEYSILTERLGGANYQLKVGSEEIINLFEISEEWEYDESSGKEVLALHLIDKISIWKGVVMTMATYDTKVPPDYKEAVAMESIIEDVISYLFEIRDIKDSEPDSLYTTEAGYQRVKKPLPTITEMYIELLNRARDNQNQGWSLAYSLLLDSLKKYVKELHYIPGIVKILSKTQYERLPMDDNGRRYYENPSTKEKLYAVVIRGTRPYFDGQSTIKVDLETPAVNIDVSQLPANDRPLAQVVVMIYLDENIIKKNSANPNRLQKRAFLVDEAHRFFRYPELRIALADIYRSARKRHIAPILSTQALADFKGYEETEAIVKNSPVVFLLRQAKLDREYLKQATCLTPAQMERMLRLGGKDSDDGSVEKKGQVCMIVNERVAFVQVDYLKDTETEVVETNMQIINEHIRARRSREYETNNQ